MTYTCSVYASTSISVASQQQVYIYTESAIESISSKWSLSNRTIPTVIDPSTPNRVIHPFDVYLTYSLQPNTVKFLFTSLCFGSILQIIESVEVNCSSQPITCHSRRLAILKPVSFTSLTWKYPGFTCAGLHVLLRRGLHLLNWTRNVIDGSQNRCSTLHVEPSGENFKSRQSGRTGRIGRVAENSLTIWS